MIKGININKLCRNTFLYIHLLRYHEVLVERAVLGTLMQESVWYHLYTVRALNPMCVWQLWHPTNAVYWDFIY